MQNIDESFARSFYHQWKNLRKSDPRLAAEFGLAPGEVVSVKTQLLNNSHLFDLLDSELQETSTAFRSSGGSRSVNIPDLLGGMVESATKLGKGTLNRATGLIFKDEASSATRSSTPLPETASYSVKAQSYQPRGAMASVVHRNVAPAAVDTRPQQKRGGLFGRMANLFFEDDADAGHRNQTPQPRRVAEKPVQSAALASILETIQQNIQRVVYQNVPKVEPVVPIHIAPRVGSIMQASEALKQVQDVYEKVEYEQEVERRYSERVGTLVQEKVELPVIIEPHKAHSISKEDAPIVFVSALDEVMYRQALKKLRHERIEIRCKGVMEIEQIGKTNRTGIRALYSVMHDYEPDVRAQVLISLINLEDAESLPLFTAALEDENARVRMAAIRGIHRFSGRTTHQFLSLALSDESTEVREISARYIGTNSDAVSVSHIIELLGKDHNSSVRKTLLQSLTRIRDKSTIPCFISLLNDPNAELRGLAAATLEEWSGKKFGFNATSPLMDREPVLEEIKQWWIQNKETFQIPLKKVSGKEVNSIKQVSASSVLIRPMADKKEVAAVKPIEPVRHIPVEEKPTGPIKPVPVVSYLLPPKPPSAANPVPETIPEKQTKHAHHKAIHAIIPELKVVVTELKAQQKTEPHPIGKKRGVKLDVDALG